MAKQRHQWGNEEKNTFTVVQQCLKCGLYRFKALGMWIYSKEKLTDKNPFPDHVPNEGCKNPTV